MRPQTDGGQTLTVQTRDPVSGWGTYVAFPALTTTGYYQYVVYPGPVETQAVANYEVQRTPLPRTGRVNMIHSGGGNWTYSLDCGLVV